MNSGALQRTNDPSWSTPASPREPPLQAGALQRKQTSPWRTPEDTDFSLVPSRGARMNSGDLQRTNDPSWSLPA